MRNRWKKPLTMLIIPAIILTGCGSSQESQTKSDTSDTTKVATSAISTTSEVVVDTKFTASDLDVGYEDSTATHIVFNGNNIEVYGEGATSQEGVLTISDKGTYVITGTLSYGQIVVDAKDTDKVQIVLNGVSINCSDNAPIYIKSADKVFITLEDKTENRLTDGTEYIQTDDTTVDGVIFSSADLTINGGGTLNITGNYKHGIASKDDLVITGGIINITAVKDALNGKDCVKIKDGTFNLSVTDGNGIQSKNGNDTTKGYVYICGGDITVTKCQEGIEGTAIIIEDGRINITAQDDGFNAASKNTDTTETGITEDGTTGTETNVTTNKETKKAPIQTLDKAPTDTLDKKTTENTNKETTEATNKATTEETNKATTEETNQATTEETNNAIDKRTKATTEETNNAIDKRTKATTDETTTGVTNVTGTRGPGQGFSQGKFEGGGENPFEVDTNSYISIKGGDVTVDASGDGIDSNGCIYISGGTTYVSGPIDSANGGLDYNGTAEITGGTIIVAGSTGMAQGFSDSSSQYSILNNLTTACKAGTEVSLTDADGNLVASYTPNKEYQSVVISTPELKKDETYTLTCGDQTTEITLSTVVTSNGQEGMGGQGGPGRPGGDYGQSGQDRIEKPEDSTTQDSNSIDSNFIDNNSAESSESTNSK